MITTSGMNWNPVLQFCIEALGADNIMWAIDYPYQESREATEFMNRAPISDVDKHKIFHKNAERVFHIKPA
jgi:predicted TIM-barrel fold metal-dependent hydrolase